MLADTATRGSFSRRLTSASAAFCVLAIVVLAMGGCARSGVTIVDDAALRAAEADPANWLTYGHTYSEQRFSTLKQVDEQSVSKLGLAWSYDLATLRGLEATPLVQDGVLYTSSAWSLVYAFDAQTGRLLWQYDPQVPKDHAKFVCCDVVNRGAALYRGRVYVGTLDGRLIALDGKTGKVVWDVQTTPKDGPYAITGAPRIANGRVIIGNAGAEYAVRGYVSAYDAETGNLVWRSYTVPGDPAKPFESEAMRRAAATWSGEWWKAGGGGTAWDTIVYDPETGLVFFGTGNGSPWYDRLRGKGDSLYVASIVALRADTGEQVWAYQTTPGDNWDYDATQPLMLATLTIEGQQRRVLMQANKNGFFYELDPKTGALISAKPYAEINWAKGMDANGRPIENMAVRELKDPTIVKPSSAGAHNWHPLSFNPATGLVYMGVLEATSLQAVTAGWKINLHDQTTGVDRGYNGPVRKQWLALKPGGKLVAWDPAAQREAWHVDLPDPGSGGTLSTAGNLVFQGRADGKLLAYRATDGKPLWEFDTGIGIMAPPMTYEAGGQQYIAVLAGWGGPEVLGNRATGHGKVAPGKLLAFALGGTATLPPYEHVVQPVPMPTFQLAASKPEIEKGRVLYATFCARCHGAEVVSGGAVPDLRYATTGMHEKFEEIVRGGALREVGMPSFAEDVTAAQVKLIQAYVLERARESARVETSSR
jgi:quinohemoprotein ethanol dehydrogenase